MDYELFIDVYLHLFPQGAHARISLMYLHNVYILYEKQKVCISIVFKKKTSRRESRKKRLVLGV
jgi:hypothetical protein